MGCMGRGDAILGAIIFGGISTAAMVAGGAGGTIGTLGTRQVAEKLVTLKKEEGDNPSWKQTAAKTGLVLLSLLAIAGITAATLGIGGFVFTSGYVICASLEMTGTLGAVLPQIAGLAAMIGSGYLGVQSFRWAIDPLMQ